MIDDESDYFTVNSVWLSKAEREKRQQREEELQTRFHASRLDRRVTLDFAGEIEVHMPAGHVEGIGGFKVWLYTFLILAEPCHNPGG